MRHRLETPKHDRYRHLSGFNLPGFDLNSDNGPDSDWYFWEVFSDRNIDRICAKRIRSATDAQHHPMLDSMESTKFIRSRNAIIKGGFALNLWAALIDEGIRTLGAKKLDGLM